MARVCVGGTAHRSFLDGPDWDFVSGGKWGYVDMRGHLIIPPQFDDARDFSEGLARVCGGESSRCGTPDELWGFIDTNGRFAIPPQFEDPSDFSEGLAAFWVDDKAGYIDQSGRVVIPPRFDIAEDFSQGLALVMVHDKPGFKAGYIDRTGAMVITPEFDAPYDDEGEFSPQGRAVVYVDGDPVVIDRTGRRVVVDRRIDAIYAFRDGLAEVGYLRNPDAEQYTIGFIDSNGHLAIPGPLGFVDRFSGGLAAVTDEQSGMEGYIDTTGSFAIAPQFDTALSFDNGLAWVRINEQAGYVDRTGRIVWGLDKYAGWHRITQIKVERSGSDTQFDKWLISSTTVNADDTLLDERRTRLGKMEKRRGETYGSFAVAAKMLHIADFFGWEDKYSIPAGGRLLYTRITAVRDGVAKSVTVLELSGCGPVEVDVLNYQISALVEETDWEPIPSDPPSKALPDSP